MISCLLDMIDIRLGGKNLNGNMESSIALIEKGYKLQFYKLYNLKGSNFLSQGQLTVKGSSNRMLP